MSLIIDFVVHHAPIFKAVGTIAGALLAVAKLGPQVSAAGRAFLDRRFLVSHLGAKKYTAEQILAATTYYVEPDCQDVDPAGAEDYKYLFPLRKNAFETFDALLTGQVRHRHTILLADSGMGKTSFVLNYYVRHTRQLWSRHKIAVVPLGAQDADDLIREIDDKTNTVILLDGFDEDTRAIRDHKGRLQQLVNATSNFKHVLITCRTQFFLRDDEIPREVTGLIRFDATEASKEYVFYKLYLSPFSESQIDQYLRRRFAFWRRTDRRKAKAICRSIGDLTARPMILANIEHLLGSGKQYEFAAQIYNDIVRRWIERERAFVRDSDALWRFSEAVATDIYINRAERGGEVIPYEDIKALSHIREINLDSWQMSSRSLLNRTADGMFKFAHRSVMEFMFVHGFLDRPHRQGRPWTDQMKLFFFEMIGDIAADKRPKAFEDADLIDASARLRASGHLSRLGGTFRRTDHLKIVVIEQRMPSHVIEALAKFVDERYISITPEQGTGFRVRVTSVRDDIERVTILDVGLRTVWPDPSSLSSLAIALNGYEFGGSRSWSVWGAVRPGGAVRGDREFIVCVGHADARTLDKVDGIYLQDLLWNVIWEPSSAPRGDWRGRWSNNVKAR